MSDFIPVDLTVEPKLLPIVTANIACRGVTFKDSNGEKTEKLSEVEKVILQVEALDCKGPEFDGCETTFFPSFRLPVGDIDAKTLKGRIYNTKRHCDGFGVSYTAKGFNPLDFEGKGAKILIGQFILEEGGAINNIDKFL